MTLVVKTAGDPLRSSAPCASEVRALDGSLPIAAIRLDGGRRRHVDRDAAADGVAARRRSPRSRSRSRRSGSTACCRTSSATGGRRLASGWRSAPAPPACSVSCCAAAGARGRRRRARARPGGGRDEPCRRAPARRRTARSRDVHRGARRAAGRRDRGEPDSGLARDARRSGTGDEVKKRGQVLYCNISPVPLSKCCNTRPDPFTSSHTHQWINPRGPPSGEVARGDRGEREGR